MNTHLYTDPYPGKDGIFHLPEHIQWRLEPKYIGETEEGGTIIDERIVMALEDKPNSFWPVIVKMSIAEAETLLAELAEVIEKRKELDRCQGR